MMLADLGYTQSSVLSSTAPGSRHLAASPRRVGRLPHSPRDRPGRDGVVYEVEQISLGRRMALKVLPFAGVLDERHLTRFRNEARAATLDHPNIVQVH